MTEPARHGDITKISELREKDEGDWDDWPDPTLTITSRVDGELRAKILARIGREHGYVALIESEVSGGYSEFTPETDCSIEVQVDGVRAWYHGNEFGAKGAMAAFLRWVEGG